MTIDSILNDLREKVANNIPISSPEFIDQAVQLNLLLLDLDDALIKAEMLVNRAKAKLMEAGATAAGARIAIQATDDYENLLLLKSRKEHIIETVRLAKKRVDLVRGHPEGYSH